MTTRQRITVIHTTDFDGFVSDVAAEVWNYLIAIEKCQTLQLHDYPGLYEGVCRALGRYKKIQRGGRCYEMH